tara:strand:- start:44 stop:616 length:573 start_codon:yes stop_codon:yes gene_type:complete
MFFYTNSFANDHKSKSKYFTMVDIHSDRDKLANEYISANLKIGKKAKKNIEYSLKVGSMRKENYDGSKTYLMNKVELQVKKSFKLASYFKPYVAARIGEKISYDTSNFTYYTLDSGVKLPITKKIAIDLGGRYRDAFANGNKYRSSRIHIMGLYELTKNNIIGLRFHDVTNAEYYGEDHKGWKLHYKHLY